MHDINKLNLAKDLAKQEEDKANRVLMEIDSVLLNRKKQLDVLLRYQSEYTQTHTKQQPALANPNLYNNFREFLSKLSTTINSEESEIARLEASREEFCNNLRELITRREVIEKLINNALQEQQQHMSQAEQKLVDDITQNAQQRRDK